MKKRILGALLVLLVAGFTYAQEVRITEKELPAVVKHSVAKYFGKKAISTIVKDKDGMKVKYDVYFQDQTEAEFRSNGELKEAKNYNGLPSNIVPIKIQTYVKRNFPNAKITKWEKGWNKQEIKLNNGLDLEFTIKGDFIRIDD